MKAKYLLAVVMATALNTAAFPAPSFAVVPGVEAVVPMYEVISKYTNNFVCSSGTFSCNASTRVESDNVAKVQAELQYYDGGWLTKKSWSDLNAGRAEVSETYKPFGSYRYRLKVTHTAYDSNYNYIESFITYSDIIDLR